MHRYNQDRTEVWRWTFNTVTTSTIRFRLPIIGRKKFIKRTHVYCTIYRIGQGRMCDIANPCPMWTADNTLVYLSCPQVAVDVLTEILDVGGTP